MRQSDDEKGIIPFPTKEKYDIFVHFDKCDHCGQETLIINYNYSKRPKYNTRLCTKCCPKTIEEGLELRGKQYKTDFFSYIKSV